MTFSYWEARRALQAFFCSLCKLGLLMPFIIPCNCAGASAPFGAFGVTDNRTGNFTTGTSKYSYGSDGVVNGTSLVNSFISRGAARYTSFGIFAGGEASGGSGSTATEKYSLPGEVVSAGSNLAIVLPNNQVDSSGVASDQNNTYGIFYNGEFSNAGIAKYIFASDSAGLSTSLLTRRGYCAAAGNGTISIFSGGRDNVGNGPYKSTEKFTFSNEAIATSTDLTGPRIAHFARSDNTTALFICGTSDNALAVPIKTVDKFNLSGASVNSGTALSNNRIQGTAIGNSTFALAVGGNGAGLPAGNTEKYTFATDAVANGTNVNSATTAPSGF